MEALGNFLSTKDGRKESTRLTKGTTKLKAAEIGGVINLETGKIKSVVILVFTAAHLMTNQGATLEERTDNTKHILDTNNASHPVDAVLVMAAAHDMENQDPQMIH